MIEIATGINAVTLRWNIIRALEPQRGRWPTIHLPDGMRRLEHRTEHGHELAVFTCKGRMLTADEEAEMRVGCAVPEDAERIPAISQDRVSDYRIGIIGQWRYQVVYRWKETAHGQA